MLTLTFLNHGFDIMSLLSLLIVLCSITLYYTRSVNYKISRESDIILVISLFLSGLVLFINGWKMDPVLQLKQWLDFFSIGYLGYSCLRLRGLLYSLIEDSKTNKDNNVTDEY